MKKIVETEIKITKNYNQNNLTRILNNFNYKKLFVIIDTSDNTIIQEFLKNKNIEIITKKALRKQSPYILSIIDKANEYIIGELSNYDADLLIVDYKEKIINYIMNNLNKINIYNLVNKNDVEFVIDYWKSESRIHILLNSSKYSKEFLKNEKLIR